MKKITSAILPVGIAFLFTSAANAQTCGSYLNFTGATNAPSYAVTNNNANLSNNLGSNFTIETWILPNDTNDTQILFFNGTCGIGCPSVSLNIGVGDPTCSGVATPLHSQLSFTMTSTNSTEYYLNQNSHLIPGVWTHVAVSYDGSMLRMYINGAPDDSVAANGAVTNSGVNQYYLGGDPDLSCSGIGRYMYNGGMFQFSIWNTTLSHATIASTYKNFSKRTQPGMVANFFFFNWIDSTDFNSTCSPDMITSSATSIMNGGPALFYNADTIVTQPVSALACNDTALFIMKTTDSIPAAYQWQVISGSTASALKDTGSVSGSKTDSLSIKGYRDTLKLVCEVMTSCGNFNTDTIKYIPGMMMSHLGGNAKSCSNINDSLFAVVTYGNKPFTYSWSTGATNDTIVASASQLYSVKVTDKSGCQVNDTMTVTINATPTVSITSIRDSVCGGTADTLNGNASGTGPFSYSWSSGATTSTADITPTIATHSYTLSVTDGNGCVSTATDDVTLKIAPIVTLTASHDSVCKGTIDTLTATGGGTYLWSTGTTKASLSGPVNSSKTYSVTVTGSNGCTTKDNILITAKPLPILSVTGKVSICKGDTGTLFAHGAATYVWDNTTSSSSITVNPLTTTTYTLEGTNVFNCSATISQTVTVNNTPTVTVSGNNSICSGNNTTLTATGSGATAPYTYTWASAGSTTSITVTPGNTTTYSVTVTDANGCMDSTTDVVTVNPTPTITVTATPTTATVCSGMPVICVATGAVSYSWSNGVSNGVPFTPSGTATYTVTGTGSDGCTSTATQVVTVNMPPAVSMTSPAFCAGFEGILTESPTGTGPFTYSWNTGGTNDTIDVSASGTYSVTITDANGCTSTDNGTINKNPLPTLIVTGDSAICSGSNTTLTATGSGTTAPYTYQWVSNGTSSSISVTPGNTTTYSVTVTDANGCMDSATDVVTVVPSPTVIVTGHDTINPGDIDTLVATGANSYAWTSGSTSDSAIVAPTTNTTYTLTGTNTNGCVDTATFTVVINVITGVGNVGNSGTLTAYPNPATEIINVTTNMKDLTNAVIKILDITGRELFVNNAGTAGKGKTITVGIANLAPGTYFMEITTPAEKETLQFIKK